jgi:hypothetical protein
MVSMGGPPEFHCTFIVGRCPDVDVWKWETAMNLVGSAVEELADAIAQRLPTTQASIGTPMGVFFSAGRDSVAAFSPQSRRAAPSRPLWQMQSWLPAMQIP